MNYKVLRRLGEHLTSNGLNDICFREPIRQLSWTIVKRENPMGKTPNASQSVGLINVILSKLTPRSLAILVAFGLILIALILSIAVFRGSSVNLFGIEISPMKEKGYETWTIEGDIELEEDEKEVTPVHATYFIKPPYTDKEADGHFVIHFAPLPKKTVGRQVLVIQLKNYEPAIIPLPSGEEEEIRRLEAREYEITVNRKDKRITVSRIALKKEEPSTGDEQEAVPIDVPGKERKPFVLE